MKTDIAALASFYKNEAWKDNESIQNNFSTRVKPSNVNDQTSHASITITMTPKSHPDKELSASLYIVESNMKVRNPKTGQAADDYTRVAVIFVNNHSHTVIFSSLSKNALEKSQKYVIQYFLKRASYTDPSVLPDKPADDQA